MDDRIEVPAQKRIEVPVWLLLFSAILHLLTVVGLVTMLVVPTLSPLHQVVTVVEIRVTATPEPTMTSLPPTATVIRPTATPVLPTATYGPPAQATVTSDGVVLDTSGVEHVEIIGKERSGEVIDANGQSWTPKNADEEFLSVYLRLPASTQRSQLDRWFGDNNTLLPAVVDENGNQGDWKFAYPNDMADGYGLTIVFIVKKDAKQLTLIFPDGAKVDLSLVPDVAAPEGTPTPQSPSGDEATPEPTPTSLFGGP